MSFFLAILSNKWSKLAILTRAPMIEDPKEFFL